MQVFLIIVASLVALIAAFIVYRLIKVRFDAKKSSLKELERLLPLVVKIEGGNTPTPEEIFPFAQNIATRFPLFSLLEHYNLVSLFPQEYLTIEKAAEGNLTNWLEFPTELAAIPDEIEYLQSSIIDFDGNNVIYHVFQFRTNPPHWAAGSWMLGVVGPYFDDSKPYDFPKATFSRLSKVGDVSVEDEVQWVHNNISMRR